MKNLHYIFIVLITIFCCSNTPNTVSPNEVYNNSQGIMMYKGQPYTGKVMGENNGYMVVEKGVIKQMIISHKNGNVAIKIELEYPRMSFWDDRGNKMSKQEFLKNYPSFKSITETWDEVIPLSN